MRAEGRGESEISLVFEAVTGALLCLTLSSCQSEHQAEHGSRRELHWQMAPVRTNG